MRLYAHRGSPGTTSSPNPLVENTVPAVTGCFADGADGIEVDLRLSADGVLVVCHDPDLRRLTGTALPVATSRWDDLRRTSLDAGVPLARVEWLLAAAAGRHVVLELKRPLPGLVEPTVEALLDRLDALQRAGLPLDVTASSFAPEMVAAVRRDAPSRLGVRTALLGREEVRPTALLRQALDAGHDEVHPHVSALLRDVGMIGTAHALGASVVAWTVNRPRHVRRLHAHGVDGIITDVPVSARLALTAPAPGLAA